MKKLNVVLDEVTVINFPFLWKLILRYYYFSILIPVLVFGISLSIYKSQNIFFTSSIDFKSTVDENENTPNSVLALIGEKAATFSVYDITDLNSSIDFHLKIAEDMYNKGDFGDMNFNSINSKQLISSRDFFHECKREKKCIITKIASVLPNFFKITGESKTRTRLNLSVTTLDDYTTDRLLEIIADNIQRTRLEVLKRSLSEQRKITEQLVEKKKIEMNNFDYDKGQEELVNLTSKIKELETKRENYDRLIEDIKIKLSNSRESLKLLDQAKKNTLNTGAVDKVKKVNELNKKIERLKQDLVALESPKAVFSLSDKQVIAGLKDELMRYENELTKIGSVDSSSVHFDNYINDAAKSETLDRYNVNMLKNQYEHLVVEIKKLNNEKALIISRKTELESQMDTFKPSIDYFKLVQNKVMQVKLAESTVVSDLIFDKYPVKNGAYKKTEFSKLLVFAAVISFILNVFCVLIRYSMDNRIFDEYELKKSFADLEVIGKTPNFH